MTSNALHSRMLQAMGAQPMIVEWLPIYADTIGAPAPEVQFGGGRGERGASTFIISALGNYLQAIPNFAGRGNLAPNS
jgi:hypothetical protein